MIKNTKDAVVKTAKIYSSQFHRLGSSQLGCRQHYTFFLTFRQLHPVIVERQDILVSPSKGMNPITEFHPHDLLQP